MLINVPDDKLKICENCGDKFFPASPRQKFCDKPPCQRARRSKNMRSYRNRKKNNPSQDPA